MEDSDSNYTQSDSSGESVSSLSASSSSDRTSQLTREDLLKLKSVNSPRITYIDKEGGRTKSDVWKQFQIIQVDNTPLQFVKCKTCHSIYAWNNRVGTTALNRHKCSDVAENSTVKKIFNGQASIKKFITKSLPAEAIDKINDTIVTGLAQDLRPLYTVEKKGFLSIAQGLIDLGAQYGKQNINDIIKHRTTLKNKHLPNLVNNLKRTIEEEISTTSSIPKLSFTTNMWSDQFKQRKFLSLHVHFINHQWKLESRMLGCNEFEDNASTDNIREFIKKIISEFVKDEDEVQEIVQQSFLITDGGSNLTSVFENRYPCFCHRLNLTVFWILNEQELPSEEQIKAKEAKGKPIPPKKLFNIQTQCPRVKDVLAKVKKLVQYFKKSGLNKELTISLKQDIQTRWNSQLTMLESYSKASEEVKQILFGNKNYDKCALICDDVVNGLIKFLSPFEECTCALSSDKHPTMQLVALWYHKLKLHLILEENELPEIRKLKQQGNVCLDEYFVVEDIHYVACMLNPLYKKLKFASESSKERAIKLLRELCDQTVTSPLESSKQTTSTENHASPASKKSKFSVFVDSDEEEPDYDEVDKYLNMSFKKSGLDENLDILDFWKSSEEFPKLKAVAKWLLAIPASQTSDERTFSTTGQTLTSKRTQLKGQTLSLLTFIHSNG